MNLYLVFKKYIGITDIICQTEIYCNTIYAYIPFKYYANYIFIITIEKALHFFFFILDFILYIHVCFSLFSTTLYFIYYVFTFKFFTLISAFPNNINSTVKYI